MSLSVQVGLLLAVATALTSIFGFLYKQRGAVQAPAVDFRRPVHSSLVLFGSGWYTLGIAIAMGSWGFHAAALSLADLARAVGGRRPRTSSPRAAMMARTGPYRVWLCRAERLASNSRPVPSRIGP